MVSRSCILSDSQCYAGILEINLRVKLFGIFRGHSRALIIQQKIILILSATVLFVFILSFIVERSFRLVRNDLVMPSDSLDRSMSSLSVDSQSEDDWDRSLIHDTGFFSLASPLQISAADVATTAMVSHLSGSTPRNSVIFPAEETPGRPTRYSSGSVLHSRNGSLDILDGGIKQRTLSDLLKLHSERGSSGDFNAEEATRIADVLGQWVG
jgi:hypothetical protein